MMAYQHALVPPLVSFEGITMDQLNSCLTEWAHRMGPLRRPFWSQAHGLYHRGELVGVAAASSLITPAVCGLLRAETVELSRLCAVRAGLCRVVLRLWREFAFPLMGRRYAISYQDEALHSGNIYRFDGWRPLAAGQHSGTDARNGRKGRTKTVWVWEREVA